LQSYIDTGFEKREVGEGCKRTLARTACRREALHIKCEDMRKHPIMGKGLGCMKWWWPALQESSAVTPSESRTSKNTKKNEVNLSPDSRNGKGPGLKKFQFDKKKHLIEGG